MGGSIRRTCRHRWLPMAVWNPRQVTTQNVDGKRRSHQDSAYPEAPVTVHSSPVWASIGLTAVAAISFGIMPVSGHLFSGEADYSSHRGVVVASATTRAAICTIRDNATRNPVNSDQQTGWLVV